MVIISEKLREARLRWLGHVERKTGEDEVMRIWKMEVGGHRKIGRPKRRWSDAPTPNRENVKQEVSYTFYLLILLGCVSLLVIIVACTFFRKNTPKSHPATCFQCHLCSY